MRNYIVVLFLLYFCNDCKEVSGHSTRSPDRKDENECDGDREVLLLVLVVDKIKWRRESPSKVSDEYNEAVEYINGNEKLLGNDEGRDQSNIFLRSWP